MVRKKIIWILIIVLIVGGVAARRLTSRNQRAVAVRTSTVTIGDIKSYLSVTGTVKSKDVKEHYGQQAKIDKVYVKVGDNVVKGDPLISYEGQEMASTVTQAQIQYDNAVLQRQELVNQNKQISNKIEELDNQIQELEDRQSPTDIQKLETLKQQRNNLSPIASERIKQADNSVALAKLSLDTAKQRLSESKNVLTAQIDGVVTALNATEGGLGNAMQPQVVIQNIQSLKVLSSVGKYDSYYIKLGQSAVIREDNKEYQGKVSFIAPVAQRTVTAAGSEAVLNIEIDVMEEAPIMVEFDVDVDILVGEVRNVRKIPAEAVKTLKGNINVVYVIEDNRAVEKEVVIGIQSDMEIEISGGLEEGEEIILNPGNQIQNGTLVRNSTGGRR
jgi:HlyD family secretion protein